MAKHDLSKILKTGSVKQRIKLLDEVRAEAVAGREILSAREYQALIDSFEKPEEVRLYNRHLRIYRAFRDLLITTESLHNSYKEAIAYITGFVLLWDTYERSEELLNSVIAQVKDKKTKDLILKEFSNRRHFLYADIEVDREGFLRFYTDNKSTRKKAKKTGDDYSIEGILRLWKAKAEERARHTKTLARVMLDYMEETGYKPKAFYDQVITTLAEIEKDPAFLPKFSKQNAYKLVTEQYKSTPDLLAKYFVYPDPDNTQILEEEYDKINTYLRSTINN